MTSPDLVWTSRLWVDKNNKKIFYIDVLDVDKGDKILIHATRCEGSEREKPFTTIPFKVQCNLMKKGKNKKRRPTVVEDTFNLFWDSLVTIHSSCIEKSMHTFDLDYIKKNYFESNILHFILSQKKQWMIHYAKVKFTDRTKSKDRCILRLATGLHPLSTLGTYAVCAVMQKPKHKHVFGGEILLFEDGIKPFGLRSLEVSPSLLRIWKLAFMSINKLEAPWGMPNDEVKEQIATLLHKFYYNIV